MNNEIVEKISALLNLARGTSFMAEAQNAMAKAHALAMKHNLDLATIGNIITEDEEIDPIITSRMNLESARLPIGSNYASDITTKFFNVKIVISGGRHGQMLDFIGKSRDVTIARYVYLWLCDTQQRLWRKHYASTPGIVLNDRQSYLYGFWVGLKTKLTDNKNRMEKENITTAESANKYAMVISNLEKEIAKFMDDFYGGKLKNRPRQKMNITYGESYNSGVKDGKVCNIPIGALGGQVRQQIA